MSGPRRREGGSWWGRAGAWWGPLTPSVLVLSAAFSQRAAAQAAQPRLSAFDRAKAEWLLENRLPCLGCHRLNGQGGVIGPDLTSVADRRTAAFIEHMIRDPLAALPGSRMPKIPMPGEWAALVARYLAERVGPAPHPADPTGSADSARVATITDGATLYQGLCAACHGTLGRGDGYNAANLPVPPTAHADSAYMSTRPDDVLFDGIYAGGYTLNKSDRMPAWGETLSRAQIRALVAYMRALCHCQGPGWSR